MRPPRYLGCLVSAIAFALKISPFNSPVIVFPESVPRRLTVRTVPEVNVIVTEAVGFTNVPLLVTTQLSSSPVPVTVPPDSRRSNVSRYGSAPTETPVQVPVTVGGAAGFVLSPPQAASTIATIARARMRTGSLSRLKLQVRVSRRRQQGCVASHDVRPSQDGRATRRACSHWRPSSFSRA